MNTTEKGRAAELVAEKFYLDRGYTLIERNYRAKTGELDLVLRRQGLLLFVEVKGRESAWEMHAWRPGWGLKLKRLKTTIYHYLVSNPELDYDQVSLEIVFVTQGRVASRFNRI